MENEKHEPKGIEEKSGTKSTHTHTFPAAKQDLVLSFRQHGALSLARVEAKD